MFWTFLLAVAAVGAAYYHISRRRLYQLAKEIPFGVKDYPIIGHGYKFMGNGPERMKSIQEFGRIANRQGGLSSIWLGPKLFICMTDPEDIAVVAKACPDKDKFMIKFMKKVLGDATIFAPVNIWHSRRKIMAPFFRLPNMQHAVRVFNEQSRLMTDLMRPEVGRGDFEIWKYWTSYILDVKLETVLGIKLKCQKDPQNLMLRGVYEMVEMVLSRIVQPWQHPDCIYERLPVYKTLMYHKERTYGFVDKIVKERRKRDTIKECEDITDDDDLSTFIDVIIQSSRKEGNEYSDSELREEVMGVTMAGNDSYSVASCFTSVLLSRYPDVQDKLYQELYEVFGDSDRIVTIEDLSRLNYLEAVIKESMRLYPPGSIIMRDVHKDVALPSGTTLVAGSAVVFNIWATHRNPLYWGEDAELFRPERFLESKLRHPAQYIPFSYSVRSCIGPVYAMFSMKTALANLVRRYRLLPPTGVCAADATQPLPLPIKLDIMIKAVDNFVVRIEERGCMKETFVGS